MVLGFSKIKSLLSIKAIAGKSKSLSLIYKGLLVLVFVLSVIFITLLMHSEQPVNIERHKTYFTVSSGMNASEIGDELLMRRIINSKLEFLLMSKLQGVDGKFKVGTYEMHTGMSTKEALDTLVQGKTVLIRFTIPEGFSVQDIAKRLAYEGIVDERKFLNEAKNWAPFNYIETSNKENIRYTAEGFLFPDTYEIDGSADIEDILHLMSNNFDNRLTMAMREKAASKNLSIYELTTLASLVEKEAFHDKDRPIIAQIFLKRLRIGMPLQADPTIQYLLDEPKEDLTFKDTEVSSPYNTYQNIGLPPGPIANPGTASIMAVLYPADTEYLYFVADREGNNYYSYSYSEHLDVVNKVR